ncbi:MAG: hypothetical protein KY434_05945 [Actinobacteria bacterium]|nr:hypothetical protein [Actinomycetota bacterium]
MDACYTVLPVNRDLIARRRGPARKTDDPEDARIAFLPALDRFSVLKPLIPHGDVATELRRVAHGEPSSLADGSPDTLHDDAIAAA